MWAVVLCVGCCMVCGLLYGMCPAGYMGCSICGLLNGMWAAGYKTCSICGMLNDVWAVVWYVGCWI